MPKGDTSRCSPDRYTVVSSAKKVKSDIRKTLEKFYMYQTPKENLFKLKCQIGSAMNDVLRRPSYDANGADSSTLISEPREELEHKVVWLRNKLEQASTINDSLRLNSDPELQSVKDQLANVMKKLQETLAINHDHEKTIKLLKD